MIELLEQAGSLIKRWWGPSIDEVAFQRLPRVGTVRQHRLGERAFNWTEQYGGGFTPKQKRQQALARQAFYSEHGWQTQLRPSAEPIIEQTGGSCGCGDPTCQLIVHL